MARAPQICRMQFSSCSTLRHGRTPTAALTTTPSSMSQWLLYVTVSLRAGSAGLNEGCRHFAAHAKIMYSPGLPDQPKTMVKEMASTSTPDSGQHILVANSGTSAGAIAWLTSRFAIHTGSPGCATIALVGVASFVGCPRVVDRPPFGARGKVWVHLGHPTERALVEVLEVPLDNGCEPKNRSVAAILPCFLENLLHVVVGGGVRLRLDSNSRLVSPGGNSLCDYVMQVGGMVGLERS